MPSAVNTSSKTLPFTLIWVSLYTLFLPLLLNFMGFFSPFSLFFFFIFKQSVRLISLCQRLSRSFLSRSNMSVARSDDILVSKPVCLGEVHSSHRAFQMFRLFDLFNNPENRKSRKCQASSSSTQGRELGGWFDVLCCLFCSLFSLFGLAPYPLLPTASNTTPHPIPPTLTVWWVTGQQKRKAFILIFMNKMRVLCCHWPWKILGHSSTKGPDTPPANTHTPKNQGKYSGAHRGSSW